MHGAHQGGSFGGPAWAAQVEGLEQIGSSCRMKVGVQPRSRKGARLVRRASTIALKRSSNIFSCFFPITDRPSPPASSNRTSPSRSIMSEIMDIDMPDPTPCPPPKPANAMAALMAGAKAKGKEKAADTEGGAPMVMSEEGLRILDDKEGLPW